MKPTFALDPVDQLIIATYFVLVVVVGVLLSRAASRGLTDYFLGGRRIPWWVLGVSGSASNFDIAGTMVVTSFLFAIGFQGFWVASRGGMLLGLAVLLGFMGKWLRRSRVITTAEWMELRFGSGPGGQLARGVSAVASLVFVVGLVIYFCKGVGTFLAMFLPFSPNVCAIGMVVIALLYTVLSGFYGVVYTDLVQEFILLIAAGYVMFKAVFLPEHAKVLEAAGPAWNSLAPRWTAEPMPWLSNPDIYHFFGICLMFWVFRSVFDGLGGFGGGYMPQRYYACRDERSAGLMTVEWGVLLCLRWGMVTGVAILGLWLAGKDTAVAATLQANPELTLPVVVGTVLPAGLKGFVLAGLIAAAMSTFDSTVNSGASYWVRDLYQRFIRPDASRKQLVHQSYLATLLIGALGVVLAMGIHNINEIWSWVTGPLTAGVFMPLVLRWYWWRFNGYGFAAATGLGLFVAIGLAVLAPDMDFYVSFPLASGASVLAGVGVSLMTAPVEEEALTRFYRRLRPFGIWGSYSSGLDDALRRKVRSENTRDLFNMLVALVWQVAMFISVVTLVMHKWTAMTVAMVITAVFSLVLYVSWYRHLPTTGTGDEESEGGFRGCGKQW